MFSKIRNSKDAVQIVRDASAVYVTLAVFQLVVALTGKFDSFSVLILLDSMANAILGVVMRKTNNRAAAIALLLNLLIAAAIGDGPLFHLLLLWPSARSVEATWKIHRAFNQERSVAQDCQF